MCKGRTIRFRLTLFLTLLCPSFVGTQTLPKPDWRNIVASNYCHFLLSQGKKTETISHARDLVDDFYRASVWNPKWGERKLCTIRLMVAAYGESGLDSNARCLNKNGTVDIGIMQVNQVHWFPVSGHRTEFERFCTELGIHPRLVLLWDADFGAQFGAHLNEMFMENGYVHNEYKFDDRPDKKALYNLILQDLKLQDREFAENN